MRRLIAIAALAAAALAGTGSQALSATQSFNYFMSFNSGPNSAFAMIFTAVDRLTGTVTQANGFVCSNNGTASCQGGAFQVNPDPIAQTAQITGTVGPMTVALDFLATHVRSDVPFFDAELNPYTISINIQSAYVRVGRTAGTITSTNGVVTVTNANSNLNGYSVVTAP